MCQTFWQALGGKHEYSKIDPDPIETTKSPPRLYRREENSMVEISHFEQKVKLTFSEKGTKVKPQTHVGKFEILHFSDNINKITMIQKIFC